jgi:hypothetical protein
MRALKRPWAGFDISEGSMRLSTVVLFARAGFEHPMHEGLCAGSVLQRVGGLDCGSGWQMGCGSHE